MNEAEVNAGLASTPGYRYAEVEGDRLFVAGQVPKNGAGDLVGIGSPAEQATACLDNLEMLMGVHGFSRDAIRQLTIYVVGEHENLLEAWQAVTDWFGGEVPPATLLGVNLLGYGQQVVEIDAVILRRADT